MMNEPATILDVPPTEQALLLLRRSGALDQPALQRALEIVRPAPERQAWVRFLSLVMLILGAGLVVSGIYFFFAYNWNSLHRFIKLGLLEGLVVAAVLLAYWLGLDRLPGKVALSAAALLVGALLAVYGQIYQTGADAYQLFVTWTLLALGWVAISFFTPLWLVWMVLVNLSLLFFWQQVLGWENDLIYLMLYLANGAAIVAWEIAHWRGVPWVGSRWSPRLLALPFFAALVAAALRLIYLAYDTSFYEALQPPGPLLWFMLGLLLVSSAAVLYLYSQKILDLFLLTICCFSLIVVVNFWVARAFEDLDELLFFLISGLLIAQSALVVAWLRRVARAWERRGG